MSVYSITDGLSGFLRFALVAIYTRSFLPEEMGILSLITTGVTFLVVALPTALHSVFIIRLPKLDPTVHRTLQSTIFMYLLLLCTGIGFLAFLTTRLMFTQTSIFHIVFWVWLWICAIVLTIVPAVSLQYQHKSMRRSIGMLTGPAITSGVIISQFLTSEVTIAGVIIAEALGATIQVIALMTLDSFFPRQWNMKLLPGLLSHGIPLTVYSFGRLIVDLSDRFIVYILAGAAAAGLYAAGTRVALVGFFIVEAFSLAWTPFSLQSISEHRFDITSFQKQSRYFMIVVAGLLSAAGIVLPILAAGILFDFALLDSDFLVAAFIVPALLLQYQFKGYYYIFTPLLTYHTMHRELIKTIYLPAIFNIAGNSIILTALHSYSVFIQLTCVSLVTTLTYCASLAGTISSLKKHYPSIRFPLKTVLGTTIGTSIPFLFWFWYAVR